MSTKTIYEALKWDGEYAHGFAYEVDETRRTKIRVGGGYHNLRTMIIQMALEEFPMDRVVRGWGTEAFAFAHERQHFQEALQLLSKVPIPWVAGLGAEGSVYHPPCFQRMGDEMLIDAGKRPSWGILFTTWPDARPCGWCGMRKPPVIEPPQEATAREFLLRVTDYEARQILNYLPVHPEFSPLRERIMRRLPRSEPQLLN